MADKPEGMPGDEQQDENGQPEQPESSEETSLRGKGWDILVGGKEKFSEEGGEELLADDAAPDAEEFSPDSEAEFVISSTTSPPAEEPPPDDAFWDRGRGAQPGVPSGELPETAESAVPAFDFEEEAEVSADAEAPDTELPAYIDELIAATAVEPAVTPVAPPEPAKEGVIELTALADQAYETGAVEEEPESPVEGATAAEEAPVLPDVPEWDPADKQPEDVPPPDFEPAVPSIDMDSTPAPVTPLPNIMGTMAPKLVKPAVEGQSVVKRVISDPFAKVAKSRLTPPLVTEDYPPKPALRKRLITPERIDELWEEINQTYDLAVDDVRGYFDTTDEVIAELKRARMLLLASEDNYDNAEEILMRAKARLRLEEKVRVWTRTRGTWLAMYLISWLFLLITLALLTNRVDEIATQFIPNWMAAMYLPALYGSMGGVIGALWVLIKHTAQKRDFDPLHTTWYVTNPFMGLALGIIAYLIVWGGGSVLTLAASGTATTLEQISGTSPILYPICLVVGFNQNLLWRLIEQFVKSITPEEAREDYRSAASETGASDANQPEASE